MDISDTLRASFPSKCGWKMEMGSVNEMLLAIGYSKLVAC